MHSIASREVLLDCCRSVELSNATSCGLGKRKWSTATNRDQTGGGGWTRTAATTARSTALSSVLDDDDDDNPSCLPARYLDILMLTTVNA